MTYQSTATFPHIKIKPSMGQYLIKEAPIIGVTAISVWIWLLANFQGHTWFVVAVAVGMFHLIYQLIYLKMTTYLITSEQIVIIKGVFSSTVGLWNCIVWWIMRKEETSHSYCSVSKRSSSIHKTEPIAVS